MTQVHTRCGKKGSIRSGGAQMNSELEHTRFPIGFYCSESELTAAPSPHSNIEKSNAFWPGNILQYKLQSTISRQQRTLAGE